MFENIKTVHDASIDANNSPAYDAREWRQMWAVVTASMEQPRREDPDARLVVRFTGPGTLCVDWLSLTPLSAWDSGACTQNSNLLASKMLVRSDF